MEGRPIRQAGLPTGSVARRDASPVRALTTPVRVAGSTPRNAVQNFLKPLQLALSCVTDAQIAADGDYSPAGEHMWVGAPSEPFPIARVHGSSLRARISQRYRVVRAEGQRGPWKVTTTAYHYTLEEASRKEIISFQWHPTGSGALSYPHVHLGHAAAVARAELEGAHIPTGRVALEQVLRFAIEAFKLRPRRPDWRDVLFGTRRRFEQWRTWE
jgi:hypothetical protein